MEHICSREWANIGSGQRSDRDGLATTGHELDFIRPFRIPMNHRSNVPCAKASVHDVVRERNRIQLPNHCTS